MSIMDSWSLLHKTGVRGVIANYCPLSYILNQIPNVTSNTFLNNSKPTECSLIPFKLWLDKCVRHSMFEFERSA